MSLQYKTIYILLCLMLCPMASNAQDTIISKDGSVITAYEVEIGGNSLFYKLAIDDSAPIHKMERANVLMVKRADGTQENFWEGATPANTPVASNIVETENYQTEEDRRDSIRNKEIRSYYEVSPEFVGEPGKYAAVLYAEFKSTSDSEFANKDIELGYSLTYDTYYGSSKIEITVSIYNRSNKTIYIDLANTFTLMDKCFYPYYTPTATASTSTGSTGVAVNLGGVANAIGASGAIGSLAKGVTVGGSKSKSVTNIEYSQRVISIPPKMTKKLDAVRPFPEISSWEGANDMYFVTTNKMFAESIIYKYTNKKFNIGDCLEFNEITTPIPLWGSYITYSFNENLSQVYHLKSEFHLKKIIGISSFLLPKLENEVKKGDNALFFIPYLRHKKRK